MSDMIPFPKPSKPMEDDTAELLRLLERISNSARSKSKNHKEQER